MPTAKLRAVMRHAAASVSVVTAAHGTELAGMTISSLNSLSLKPLPLVSINIQVPSRTSRLIHASGGHFVVNMLGNSAESIKMARVFAGNTSEGHNFNPFSAYPEAFSLIKGQNIPLLGCAASYLRCTLVQHLHIQDHELIVARVTDAVRCRNDPPLLYHNHTFGSVGKS